MYNFADNGQSNAGSDCTVRTFTSLVWFPDTVAIIRRNASSPIFYDYSHRVIERLTRDRDGLSARSVLHCVVEKIEHRLAKHVRLNRYHNTIFERSLDGVLLDRGERLEPIGNFIEIRCELDVLPRCPGQCAPLDSRELQNIVHEARETRDLALHVIEDPVPL